MRRPTTPKRAISDTIRMVRRENASSSRVAAASTTRPPTPDAATNAAISLPPDCLLTSSIGTPAAIRPSPIMFNA
nr:hypothetical protein [Rhodococcus sp. WMMA185]